MSKLKPLSKETIAAIKLYKIWQQLQLVEDGAMMKFVEMKRKIPQAEYAEFVRQTGWEG